MLVLFALGYTLVAVLASAGAAAVVSGLRAEAAARRRARVRDAELANLAAAAQRWRVTPRVLGGPAADGFGGVSFDALGLETRLFRPSERRTESGVYRMVPVPPCAAVDAAASRAGLDAGGDALLVVGHDPVSGHDAAVVVLSPLVQIPLARVPWGWIAELSRREAPAARPAEPLRAPDRPAPAADRPEAPRPTPLRLVAWAGRPIEPRSHGPDRPSERPGRPPPVRRLTRWRRAA